MAFHGGDIYSLNRTVLDYSSNINPLGVPESFKEALIECIDEFTKYPDIQYRELKGNIGKYLNIESRYIVPGNGAVEIIHAVIASCNVQAIATLSPTFAEYREGAKRADIPCYEYNVFNEDYTRVDLQSLLEQIEDNTGVVICNPNNPTGTFIETNELVQFLEKLVKKKSFLIVDEAFIEFTDEFPNNSMIRHIEEYQNLFVVKAATKFFGMPGIRLGYGISGNYNILNKIEEKFSPWCVNTSAVIAARTVFFDKEYILKSGKLIKEEREFFVSELNNIKNLCAYTTNSNFILLKILDNNLNAHILKERLLRKDVLIRTPEGFNSINNKYFRLAIKDRVSNNKVLDALREVMQENTI